jgi:Cysteine-rich secretory protein family
MCIRSRWWISMLMPRLMSRGFRSAIAAVLMAMTAHAAVAEDTAPADQISAFRLRNGEGRVTRDATLDRIAMEQARAMADKDDLSHEVLGPFTRRVAPSNAGRAAENIAYGYESFEKTLGQWIDSSEHRRNLLLPRATRVGIASAKDASGKRTYWAMEIAGDYEPKPGRGKGKDKGRVIAGGPPGEGPVVKREVVATRKPAASKCHINLLGLCL